MSQNQDLLKAQFPDLDWLCNFPLAEQSYFKIGGPAELYLETKDLEKMKAVLHFCETKQIPWTILGGGSNVLIDDVGIPGLVLKILAKEEQILVDNDQELKISVAAGMKTNALVMSSVRLEATGLEGFIGVPGTVGGAIYNNAHYLNFLIGDFVETVIAFHVKNNEELLFSQEKCQFAYEQSIFQTNPQLVILSVQFRLKKGQPEEILEKVKAAQKRRQDTQPLNYPSSGCVFQNPPNTAELKKLFPQFANQAFIPAGFLIDQAGLKGKQIGQIAVSEQHAAFLINLAKGQDDQASAQNVKLLIDLIKSTVKSKFAINLKEEIFYLPKESKT